MPRLNSKSVNGGKPQKTILNFFSTSPSSALVKTKPQVNSAASSDKKVKNDESLSAEDYGTPCKKAKHSTDSDTLENTPVRSSPLTPEIRKSINDKATAASLLKASNMLKVMDPKMGITWFTALEKEFRKDYFKMLNNFVVAERSRATIFPPAENVWEWTKQYPIENVKVVILGQDPYHGVKQAHGLCFSVQKGIPPPPSLVNMYKELTTDIPGFVTPNHGCLKGWADQGVLLLNAVLTVESSKANSHKDKGWEKITDAVISYISDNLSSVVFLLWGSYAQKKAAMVNKNKHCILQGPHPSPLSAHRGFFECKHFSKCNEMLTKHGKEPIDWSHLP